MATISRPGLPTQVRAPVRAVGSGVTLPVTFDVRTAYDFALSLASEVGEQDELLPTIASGWWARARRSRPRRRSSTTRSASSAPGC